MTIKKRLGLGLYLFLLCFACVSAKKANRPNQVQLHELLKEFQKRWEVTKSYQTRFKQLTYSKTLGTRDQSEGTLSVKKPNKLRWEGEDGSVEIINGVKGVTIQKNRRTGTLTVDIYTDISKRVDMKGVSFLAGSKKLQEIYECQLGEEKGKTVEVRLKPKEGVQETHIAKIDKESYGLLSLTTDSVDARIVLEFVKINTDVDLPDSLFEYQKSGKDIVHINP